MLVRAHMHARGSIQCVEESGSDSHWLVEATHLRLADAATRRSWQPDLALAIEAGAAEYGGSLRSWQLEAGRS